MSPHAWQHALTQKPTTKCVQIRSESNYGFDNLVCRVMYTIVNKKKLDNVKVVGAIVNAMPPNGDVANPKPDFMR